MTVRHDDLYTPSLFKNVDPKISCLSLTYLSFPTLFSITSYILHENHRMTHIYKDPLYFTLYVYLFLLQRVDR